MENTGASWFGLGAAWDLAKHTLEAALDPVGQIEREVAQEERQAAFDREMALHGYVTLPNGAIQGYVMNANGGRDLLTFSAGRDLAAKKAALEAAQEAGVNAAVRADDDRRAALWIQGNPRPQEGALLTLHNNSVMYRAVQSAFGTLVAQRLTDDQVVEELQLVEDNRTAAQWVQGGKVYEGSILKLRENTVMYRAVQGGAGRLVPQRLAAPEVADVLRIEAEAARIENEVELKKTPTVLLKQRARNALMEAIQSSVETAETTRKSTIVEVDGQFFGFDRGDVGKILGPARTRNHILVHNGLMSVTDAAAKAIGADRGTSIYNRRFVALDGTMYGCAESKRGIVYVQGKTELELARNQASVWMDSLEEGAKPGAFIQINERFYGPLIGLGGSYSISAGYPSIPDLQRAKEDAIASKQAFDRGVETVKGAGSWALSQTGRLLVGAGGLLKGAATSTVDAVASGTVSLARGAQGLVEQQREAAIVKQRERDLAQRIPEYADPANTGDNI